MDMTIDEYTMKLGSYQVVIVFGKSQILARYYKYFRLNFDYFGKLYK